MSIFFKKALPPCFVVLGMTAAIAPSVLANPVQQTSQAVPALGDRYGCFAGYPDGSFRGDRPVTRYEFAAVLNACLQQIDRAGNIQFEGVTREEFEATANQFELLRQELDSLRDRVDLLDPENK